MIKKEYIKPEINTIVILTENLMGATLSQDSGFADGDGFMSKEEPFWDESFDSQWQACNTISVWGTEEEEEEW